MIEKLSQEEYEKDRLIIIEGKGDFVAVHHGHLDQLIGSLMHLCELDSDKEHREALKSDIKMRCRQWLNDQYDNAGYQKYLDENRLGQKMAR